MPQLENSPAPSDGVLVFPATYGLGFHLLSALIRLGKNCRGLDRSDRSGLPFPLHVFDWDAGDPQAWPAEKNTFASAVFILSDEIRSNRRPAEARLEKLERLGQHLLKENPQLHWLLVLPYNTPETWRQRFHDVAGRVTLFLTPPVFGFGDAGLMDLSLAHRDLSEGALKGRQSSAWPVGLVSAPDLCGFLISALQNARVFSQDIWVPEQVKDLGTWVSVFKKYFTPEHRAPVRNLLASVRGSPLADLDFLPLSEPRPATALSALEAFPSPLQSLERFMRNSAETLSRAPESPSHFLAPRAL